MLEKELKPDTSKHSAWNETQTEYVCTDGICITLPDQYKSKDSDE